MTCIHLFWIAGIEDYGVRTGVAVGAGELEDETIKELAEIKRELETTKSALSKAETENQKLRARLASVNAEEQDN